MSTITPDSTSEIFPSELDYGYIVSPVFLTDIVKRQGGYERLNSNWSRPLLSIIAAPLEDTPLTDMEELRDFYYAMRGEATYFRFKDRDDYKSVGKLGTIAALDQPLVEVIDAPGTYQLIKRYTKGSATQDRGIVKPVGSTVVVANDSMVEQSDWTLDEATGILTPGGGFSGTPTTWGGEFYVEVRFDGKLQIQYDNYGTQSTRVAMQERRRTPTT